MAKLHWPPAVTIDIVIFTIEDGELKVMLIKRNKPPFAENWALPGGFLLKNEATKDGALRTLKEKTGVGNVYIEQLYTFDSLSRDPRGHILTVAYFALVSRPKIIFGSGKDLQTPALVSVNRLPKLAFDHKKIINYALERLQYKLEYTNAVFSLLPKKFTFSELQEAYEVIFGKKIDKRNFRKKFLALGLIKETHEIKRGLQQRPARLYEFKVYKPISLKRFF